MPDAPWKVVERKVCAVFGGKRRGPTGAAVSDCIGTDVAVSIKRSKRGTPLGKWITEARAFGKDEKAEWALVVVQPGQNVSEAVVCIRLGYLAELRESPFDQTRLFE